MQRVIKRLETQPMTRILALGSSNTERAYHCRGWHNWFDWVDVGLRDHFGRVHHAINAGASGETSTQLLQRFERDVTSYQPHVVFITVGGNDTNPEKNVPIACFRRNLLELVDRCLRLGDCVPILQTYYSIDLAPPEKADPGERNFPLYMQEVREAAAASEVPLIDHLRRWERLRKADYPAYRALLRDGWHVNPLGNMVLGLDVLRCFGVEVKGEVAEVCGEGLAVQRRLDELEMEGARPSA